MKQYMEKPIPVLDDLEHTGKTAFVPSPLIQVLETDRIKIAMQYPRLGFTHVVQHCFVRKEVEAMLQKAADRLDPGYSFLIWDAWRPFALQKELFDTYRVDIIKEFHLEDKSPEEQKKFINKFVANPVRDPVLPPAHTTGGALDLTILDKEGRELEMGCGFDDFTDKTRTAFFERKEAAEAPNADLIRRNRRFLHNLMLEAGFTNLPSEWWHYEYGDQNWSAVVGKPALYDGIFEL